MHKSEINQLVGGAEDTTSSSEDDLTDEQIIAKRKAKRDQLPSSMQRSIDRLLKATIEDSKKANEDGGKKGSIIDKDGKIKFDRRLYDLDTYRTILNQVKGYDYRPQKPLGIKVEPKKKN